jgi:hypothetical protein
VDASRCTSRELGEVSKGKSNIDTCSDLGKHEFAKEATVRVAKFGGKGVGFRGAFNRGDGIKEKIVGIMGKRRARWQGVVHRIIPSMCLE